MSTPVIRASAIQDPTNVSTINVAFPAGSVAGDLALIFGSTGYTPAVPSGWTAPVSTLSTGAEWRGLFIYRQLTSGDISTGYVTVSFGGPFDAIFGIVVFVGNPGPVRIAQSVSLPVTGAGSNVIGMGSNGIGDANDRAISFSSARGSGSATITTSVGTTLQSAKDGANASGILTDMGAMSGGFVNQTWTYSPLGFGGQFAVIAIVGPVPAVAAGIPTVVELEFGDQTEPWPLQGLSNAADLNLGQVEVGDIVIVGYASGSADGALDQVISDTNHMAWQVLYQDTVSAYFMAVVTAAAASDIINFSVHGYSQAGRLTVIRGASASNTNAVANASTQPIAITLGPVSVSYTYYSGGSAWSALLLTAPGLFQSTTILMAAVAVPEVTHGNPGSSWVDLFPSDDSVLNVYLLTTLIPQSVQLTLNPSSPQPATGLSAVEVKVTVYYQNPGNFLYARDVNSWGDGGVFGANNGIPYAECNIVIGSIQLSQLGAPLLPLEHIVGYFDAVGTLNNGGPSQPDIWILPNEISGKGVDEPRFVQLPEITQEPPTGQNHPSATIQALRWSLNMMNSQQYSQFIHHLQVKIQFEPENAPNTIKAIAFKQNQED